MTINFRPHLLLIMMICIPLLSLAQSNLIAQIADSTDIEGQFKFLYDKSNTFEQHKVISINDFNALKQNATDSIKLYKNETVLHLNETDSLNSRLKAVTEEIAQLKEELLNTQNMQDSVLFLGIPVSKIAYNLIMWGIILILTLVSVILYLMFKQGHKVVTEAKTRLIEVQEDLERLRKNAIAREQALGQELTIYKLKHKH